MLVFGLVSSAAVPLLAYARIRNVTGLAWILTVACALPLGHLASLISLWGVYFQIDETARGLGLLVFFGLTSVLIGVAALGVTAAYALADKLLEKLEARRAPP